MDTYQNSQSLYKIICRVKKAASSFVYFTLEANEGIAFYSTLKESKDSDHRDILIHGPIELKSQLMGILNSLSQKFDVELLLDETIQDSSELKLQL